MHKSSQIVIAVVVLALYGLAAASAQSPRQSSRGLTVLQLAERGDSRAQTRLGYMLATGQGVPQNYAEFRLLVSTRG